MAGLMNIPQGEHWAIIQETSVHIPGDERSRTNPGHGYGEHTETHITYESFTDRVRWEERVTQLTLRRDSFRAVYVKPAKVSTTVSVDIS